MTKTRWIVAGAIALGLLGGGASFALATSSGPGNADGTESPITGDALAKAQAAALEHTGGGRVTDTEIGDEEGYYEVEVTMPDGRQVDVHLDQEFAVLSTESDTATETNDGGR